MAVKQKKKLDLYQVHKAEYTAPRLPVLVKIGPAKYLTIAKMKEVAGENRLSFHGLHHEIYLSDPWRVAPARLRTILRHPLG
jgi:hypothetical protein